jgi:hypothetical protein
VCKDLLVHKEPLVLERKAQQALKEFKVLTALKELMVCRVQQAKVRKEPKDLREH